jgi:hypothetical protein
MINQFPFENVVTVKDLLSIVCKRIPDSSKWLPLTYNLNYELPNFVSYFQKQEKKDVENHWIIKPWNLARSIDTYVTKNLNQIIRLQETGPKVSLTKYYNKKKYILSKIYLRLLVNTLQILFYIIVTNLMARLNSMFVILFF